MTINVMELPDGYLSLVSPAVERSFWINKNDVDAYGFEWEGMDLDLYHDPATIQREIEGLYELFKIDTFSGEFAGWTEFHSTDPGFIPYITDFSKIVCIGTTPSGESFCLDFREKPQQPSVIFWNDGYWRRVAPSFDEFISLFEPR